MVGGDPDDFIDYMNDGDAAVRYKNLVYRFSGLKYHPGRDTWSLSVERYRFTKEPFEDFLELVYYYESADAEDVLDHLTEDILWEGKTFYELEKALCWMDW